MRPQDQELHIVPTEPATCPRIVDVKCSHYTDTKMVTIFVMDVLINLIVAIISQCIIISKHHVHVNIHSFICLPYLNKAREKIALFL